MEKNNQLSNKNEIITLILADMRNRKLIMGLDAIGLCTDDFNTNLSELIFTKMQISKQSKVGILNWYEDTIYHLLDVDLNKFREHQLFFAVTMYDAIQEKKNKLEEKNTMQVKNKDSFFNWNWFKRFDN